MKYLKWITASLLALFTATATLSAAVSADDSQNFHSFKVESLALEEMDFSQFKGKVVLLVNTASFCGYTGQYKGLQALYDSYKDKGLVVVGAPSGDFNNQEYDKNSDIKEFCEKTYQVKFPMTDKMSVKGEKRHAIYSYLADKLGEKSAPRWNFHKYLIGKDGEPITYFSTRTKPGSDKIIKAVEAALSK